MSPDRQSFDYTESFRARSVPMILRLAHFVRAVILSPILLIEWKAVLGKRRSQSARAIMLLNDISNSTHGRGLDVINQLICTIRNRWILDESCPPDSLATPAGWLVGLDELSSYVEDLQQIGFTRVNQFVENKTAIQLGIEISDIAGTSSFPAKRYASLEEWRQDNRSGPRFTFDSEQVNVQRRLASIAENSAIREIAKRYIGCPPILVSRQVWATRVPSDSSTEVMSDAAMAFHCDSDYFGFLKFFVLLTDVGPNNGPFTFVARSHRGRRHVAGRMRDSEIISGDDELCLGIGQAGDLIIADTKGWHKATPPKLGFRTMFQVVYSSSLFGSPT